MATQFCNSGWKVMPGDKLCQVCKIECIKHTNPCNLTVETADNRTERQMSAIEMSVTNNATSTNYKRMLEDIVVSPFKTHTVTRYSHKH